MHSRKKSDKRQQRKENSRSKWNKSTNSYPKNDPNRKTELADKTQPVRRTYIPKPGKQGERRPLGIPTIKDRARQPLALE